MPLRSWIKHLERASREDLESFDLFDGSRYYFAPTAPTTFMHFMDCVHAGSAHNWPELLRKVCEAKDVEAALWKLGGGSLTDLLVYDPEVLINERRLVPTSFVSRYDPETGKRIRIDPYEYEPEDLSE
jgi:hypothetical protein